MKRSGLDSVATRIMGGEDTTALTNDQVEKALGGTDALNQLASKLGVSASSAASAAGFLLPRVIGYLTPEGKVPDHLPNEVHEFIRHHALAKVEEAPRRETYETPRREVVHEAPRRETYVAPPRRVEPVHEQDEQSWFWWALPLIGLALLGAYAAKSCTPVREPRVYTPPVIQRREARPVAPEPAPAPVERREPATAPVPAPVEHREPATAPVPAPVEHREPVVLPTPGQPTTVTAAIAPRLVIDRTDDGHVRVSGVVADDAERRAILTALDTAFGADKVISNIGIDSSAAPAAWLSHLLDVARLVAANPRAALTLEGSKLTLGGPVSASDKRSLIDSIKTILGSGFTVEHREPVVLPTPGQPTTVTAAIAPWLVIDRTDDGHVRVSGVVADDAERRAILTALDTAFGADKVISNIGIDPSAAPAGWLSHLLDVARLVAANPRAALTLEGSKLTLGGPVSASDKRSLIDSIKTILGSGFTID